MEIVSRIKMGDSSRGEILKGINIIANAVRVTLGAAGRTVVLDHQNYPRPHITKDGVTVANAIFLDDPVQHIGVRLIKSVARNAVDATGDGTTSATVLAQEIMNKGVALINSGTNPIKLQKGMEMAKDEIIRTIMNNTTPIYYKSKELLNIATISANNDKAIGKEIAEAVNLAGEHGSITVEQSNTSKTTMEHVDGVRVDAGLMSNYFVNQMNGTTVLDNPLILISNHNIQNFSEITHFLSNMAEDPNMPKPARPIIIIASEIFGEALNTLVANANHPSLIVVPIQAPSFGDQTKDYLSDIATLTGGKFIPRESGTKLNDVTFEELGQAQKIIIDKNNTKIIGAEGSDEDIEALLKNLSKRVKTPVEGEDIDFLKERLAKISGGVIIVKVGGQTKEEMIERKDRFDDSVGAAQAAVEQGVVSGGGIALVDCYKADRRVFVKSSDRDIAAGYNLVYDSISAPAKQILANAGHDEDVISKTLANLNDGELVDVLTDKRVNAMKAGIIDPSKVVISALEAAVSISGITLTTEVAIFNVSEPRKQ